MGYFQTHNGWPVGCTAVTVFGITSQLRAQAQFKILAQGATNTNKGQTTLTTTILNGTQPNGVQGATVNIRGRDYRSEEYLNLYVVQPDGTIVYLTPPLTSKIGNFQMTVTLGMNRQVGTYTFVAVGQNGFGSTADFTLYPAPIFAQGFGQLRIADPQPVELAQGKAIQLQGRNFGADEAVVITLIQPDGVHADLMTTQSNQVGEIAITLGTNVQMPIGKQQILAASATTAVTSEISITYGEPVIPLEALLPKLPSGDPLPPSLGVLPYPSTVALPNAVQPIFLRPVAPTTSVAPVSVPVIVDVQPAPSQPTPTPYWPPF